MNQTSTHDKEPETLILYELQHSSLFLNPWFRYAPYSHIDKYHRKNVSFSKLVNQDDFFNEYKSHPTRPEWNCLVEACDKTLAYLKQISHLFGEKVRHLCPQEYKSKVHRMKRKTHTWKDQDTQQLLQLFYSFTQQTFPASDRILIRTMHCCYHKDQLYMEGYNDIVITRHQKKKQYIISPLTSRHVSPTNVATTHDSNILELNKLVKKNDKKMIQFGNCTLQCFQREYITYADVMCAIGTFYHTPIDAINHVPFYPCSGLNIGYRFAESEQGECIIAFYYIKK